MSLRITFSLIACFGILAGEESRAEGSKATAKKIDYQRDVRPILSANCFPCHGPDANTREADLRLDLADAAYEDRGGYAALVPGDAHRSELLDRVLADEPGELMPPADSGKQLTAEQIDMLRAWIEEGAEYQQHWAFAAPKESVLTSVQNSEWPHNAIDTFVLSRLEEQGMTPAPEADRYQLVRRVYLDLIGLPPTIQEADEFVSDARPDAYERLVDRLLASPHYGERWARRWLDLARYSDTKGYEKDQPRTMWLYRDWVIKALNDDMPFDQFTIEQIAGDMLPEATLEQRIATGFHRNTMTNEEGGIDPQEFRYHAIVDRVATTGTTWLGLTLGCAQCHTHKFDPITHTEYFQVFAFLNNADELKISVPQPKVAEERREIEAELEATLVDLERRFPFESRLGDKDREEKEQAIASSFQQWSMEHSSRLAFWTPLRPQQVQSNLPITTVLEDHSILASGDVTKNDTFELTFKVGPKPITAIRLEALPHSSLPGGGPGRQIIVSGDQKEGNFYLSEVDAWVTTTSHTSAEPTPIEFEKATASFVPPGLDADRAIDGKPDTGWTIAKQEGNRHAIVLHLAKPLQLSKHERLKVRLQHEFFYPAGLGRFRISTTSAPNEVKPSDLPEEVVLALIIPEEKRTSHQQRRLYREYLLQTPEFQSEQAQVEKLEARLPSYPTALVMSERSEQHRRQTARHHRGEYLQPKEQVQPGGLAALHAFPKAAKLDRLAFAKWLISPENPLVARVVVNRQWEAIFGRGLVRTSEDFGTQSEFPTHPKLLDWLAVEFMERGWSLKHIHKLIVMSATYRQSSLTDDNKRSHDPENKLLSRGPRLRVESELVRDIVLKSSGLLSSKIGGPSVFPPQPPGITEAAYGALQWKVSLGEDPYRRGLYTFNKRTAPYAAFGIFDAPSGEVCVPRRDRSNTPLQSLALLNDEVVLEAARSMASSEIVRMDDDDSAIAKALFRRCVTRPPRQEETSSILAYYQRQLERFRSGRVNPYLVLNSGPSQTWQFDQSNENWSARNDCKFEVTEGKLVVTSSGGDPFMRVSHTAPAGPYVLKLNARFETAGTGEVFWTTTEHPEEAPERSARFTIIPNEWHDYEVQFKAKEQLTSLRLDLGNSAGIAEIEHIALQFGDGLFEIPGGTEVDRLAAWMLTARALLNLDETITKS